MTESSQTSVFDAEQLEKHFDDLERAFKLFVQTQGLPKWERSEKEFFFSACEVAYPFLNAFCMLRFPDEESLRATVSEMAPSLNSLCWGAAVFPHTTPKNAREVLRNIEIDGNKLFQMELSMAGMVLQDEHAQRLKDGEALAKKVAPGTGITVTHLNRENVEDFARVQFLANGMPDVKEYNQKYAEAMLRADTNAGSDVPIYKHFLVWANDKLVSIGSYLMVNSEIACIFEMATLPEERQKGYGAIMLEKLVFDAMNEHNAKQIILHGTDMGQPLYSSFGFVKTCDIPVFGRMAS